MDHKIKGAQLQKGHVETDVKVNESSNKFNVKESKVNQMNAWLFYQKNKNKKMNAWLCYVKVNRINILPVSFLNFLSGD